MTDRSTDGGQQTRDEISDGLGQLDQEDTAVVADDGEQALNGIAQVVDQSADLARSLDDLTDGVAEDLETEAVEDTSDRAAQLDEEDLRVDADDLEQAVDDGGDVLEETVLLDGLAALEVRADLADDLADGAGEGLQTQTREGEI